MRLFRTFLCLTLAALMLISPLPTQASGEESTTPYIQRLLQYYRFYQEDASEDIAVILEYISTLDPEQGAMWDTIMADWAWCNQEFQNPSNSLPEGLPDDDSLCIVVLGYCLSDDGSMQPELIQRLETALDAAYAYPNAYIAVTGGATASYTDDTEAGQMAAWLEQQGVNPDRLILETSSYSTTQNVVNTCRILENSYPSVGSIAVITSDYHAAWGCSLFQALCDYKSAQGGYGIPVVACAANATETSYSTMYYQARGIADITGIPYSDRDKPSL